MFSEYPFYYVGGYVQSANLSKDLLEPTCFSAIVRIYFYFYDQLQQMARRQVPYFDEFANPVISNPGGNTGLVISYRDRHHRHSV